MGRLILLTMILALGIVGVVGSGAIAQDSTPLVWPTPGPGTNEEIKELIKKFVDKTPQSHEDRDFINDLLMRIYKLQDDPK